MVDLLQGKPCIECGHPVGVDPDDPGHLKGNDVIHLRCDEGAVTSATIGADRAFKKGQRERLIAQHLKNDRTGHPQVTKDCQCCATEVNLWIMRVRRDVFGFERLARKTDPETSKRAAEKIQRSGAQKSIKDRVLAALVASPEGLTYSEAAVAAGVKEPQAWRRLSDLKNEGKVTSNGTRVINGYEQTIWTVKPGQGRLF